MESGTLFQDGKRWRFHVPLFTPIRVKKAKEQLAENPDLPITTVDLGVNNLAVAFHGAKVKGTLFLSGRQHEQRRFRKLKAIAVRQRKTGCRPIKRSKSTNLAAHPGWRGSNRQTDGPPDHGFRQDKW